MFVKNAIIMFVIAGILFFSCLFENKIYISIPGIKKSSANLSYTAIMLFFLILGTCITDSYDIGSYRDAYIRRIAHSKEPLFDAIKFFFFDKGVGFDTFKFLWLVVITLLLYRGIRNLSNKPEQVVALSFFVGFLSFVTQMRSALAFAIILIFIPFLYTGKKRDRIIYGIVVVLCGSFHIVSWLFLLFLLIKRTEKRNFKGKYYLFVLITTLLTVVMNTWFVQILTLVYQFIPVLSSVFSRIIVGITGIGTTVKAAIFLVCKQIVLYGVTERACKLQIQKKPAETRKYEIISELNTLSLIFLPICIINGSFMRVFVPILLIQLGVIVDVGHETTGFMDFKTVNISMKTFAILFAIFLFVMEIRTNSGDFVRMMNSIHFF